MSIRVLFLCTGNSARSQMAEALLRAAAGPDGGIEVVSAGTEPRGVHPLTVRALGEAGIDWSGARSKSVREFLGQEFDYVVTVCDRARQACPVFPGDYRQMHWDLEDPAEVEGTEAERLEAFRRTRDDLREHVAEFLAAATGVEATVARPGGVSYLQIPAADPVASAAFYRALFGWRIHGLPDHPAFEDGTGHVIGAWVGDRPASEDAGVVPYVYVADVRATLDRAVSLGARAVRAPYPEGRLTVATFRDPSGTVVGIWQQEQATPA